MFDAPLMDLSIDEGKRIKWERGQVSYGTVFVGNPICECFDELLDAMNYVDEGRKQGLLKESDYQFLHGSFKNAARCLQIIRVLL
jgi:hypothetical protein